MWQLQGKKVALTIGDLSKATNTKVETVRYYERIGLLPKPTRSGGNYRTYGAAELGRLSFPATAALSRNAASSRRLPRAQRLRRELARMKAERDILKGNCISANTPLSGYKDRARS